MDAALNSAASALISQSKALSTISTNLANSGTSGYKAVSNQFFDLLNTAATSSTNTSTGGVSVGSRQNVTLGGTITSTTSSTDMALDGNGFFVVSDGTNTYYTRDGDFTTDSSGNLYLSGTNYYLMGWSTNTSGTVTGSETSGTLEKINVNKYSSAQAATTTYSLSANLPADAQTSVNTVSYTNDSGNSETLNYAWVSTGTNSDGNNTYLVSITPSNSSVTLDDGTTSGASQLTYTVETDSDGNIVSVTGTTGNTIGYSGTELPTSITASDNTSSSVDTSAETWSAVKSNSGFSKTSSLAIYDSKGNEEDVPVTWTAAGDNTWVMTVSSPIDSTGSASGTLSDSSGGTTSSYSYSVSFNSDGSLKSITPISEMNGSSISTAPTDSSGNAEVSVYSWNDNSAASTVSLNLGTSGSTSGLTQLNSGLSSPAVTTKSHSQDGYATGTLQSVSVNSSGEIVANYSNNESIPIYMVAVANFANANGLQSLSDNVYKQTSSSGNSVLGEAGANGTGSIKGGSLENSTVSSSTELSTMITAQQAYSSASQVISSSSKMFESLMQVI
ncbi:MAG TPA: flagellar hook-basal body complex protein [Candidatus Sulfotelmatobacter sp.]|jgi:flagellar hook protein FlgE|nr:flagellar hook-basal body complex protein [Candidatus Sulfotelmatobacter sp.]